MKTININGLECYLIRKNTKKAQEINNNYDKSDYYTLFDAYAKPSYIKENAYNSIMKEKEQYKGWGDKIINKCIFTFTVGYLLKDNNNKIYLIYHTPSYRYAIEL